MHQRSINIFIALALLVGTATAVQAAYRWVDKDGNVQYSQHHPGSTDAEYISPPPSTAPVAKTSTGEAAAAPKPKAAPTVPQKGMSREDIQAAIDNRNKENCEMARINLRALSQPGLLRTKNAQGEIVDMPPGQREQKMELARQQIQELCK